jgi:hypothetical protein
MGFVFNVKTPLSAALKLFQKALFWMLYPSAASFAFV